MTSGFRMSRAQIVRYRCCEHCEADGHDDDLIDNHEPFCSDVGCKTGKKAAVRDA